MSKSYEIVPKAFKMMASIAAKRPVMLEPRVSKERSWAGRSQPHGSAQTERLASWHRSLNHSAIRLEGCSSLEVIWVSQRSGPAQVYLKCNNFSYRTFDESSSSNQPKSVILHST